MRCNDSCHDIPIISLRNANLTKERIVNITSKDIATPSGLQIPSPGTEDLALPATRSLTPSPFSCIFRQGRRTTGVFVKERYYTIARPFPPCLFSAHMCCTHTRIYQAGWRVTLLVLNTYESRGRRESARRRSGITHLCVRSAVPYDVSRERWIIHERVVPRLIGARILRVRTREGYFATVVVGSSSRMGIIAARHPGKFKDMTVSRLQRSYVLHGWSRKTRRSRETALPNCSRQTQT